MNNKLDKLVTRLAKLNISVELGLNYPWVYLDKVNNKRVTELYSGNPGFTICYLNGKEFLSLKLMFKIIRKYK
jgi:hypothetical protein